MAPLSTNLIRIFRVTFVEYWQENTKIGKILCFSWVTDLEVNAENVFQFMRDTRARWKIENETFNTLKNQCITLVTTMVLAKKPVRSICFSDDARFYKKRLADLKKLDFGRFISSVREQPATQVFYRRNAFYLYFS